MSEDIKAYLYAWLGRKKLTPVYEIEPAGNRNRLRYMCKLNVDGFTHVGMGNSTNKKDAQSNAARDFCQFLVRRGEMKAEDVPGMTQTQVFRSSIPLSFP